MKTWLQILIFFTCTSSFANAEFEFVHTTLLTNKDVLIQNQNGEVGRPLSTNLKFEKWVSLPIEMPEESASTIGLTKSGHLYQYIQVGRDRFARLLSGKKCIREFGVTKDSLQLLARDCDGSILIYSAAEWAAKPLSGIVKKRSFHTVVGMTFISLATWIYAHFGDSGDAANMVGGIASIFGSMAYAQIQLAAGFIEYGQKNTHPDGLIATNLNVASIEQLDDRQLESAFAKNEVDMINHWHTDCGQLLKNKPPAGAVFKVEDEKVL